MLIATNVAVYDTQGHFLGYEIIERKDLPRFKMGVTAPDGVHWIKFGFETSTEAYRWAGQNGYTENVVIKTQL